MRSSLPKLLVITCDLLFVAALLLAFASSSSKDFARLHFAAALFCLLGSAAGWIFGYRYETRRKKTQTPEPDIKPPDGPL